jgi:hypothetical protein
MANRVEECLRKAKQCERAGRFAVTLEARLMSMAWLSNGVTWLTVLRKLTSNLPRSGRRISRCACHRPRLIGSAEPWHQRMPSVSLPTNRYARGSAQCFPDRCGVLVVRDLPRNDSRLAGNVDDRPARR